MPTTNLPRTPLLGGDDTVIATKLLLACLLPARINPRCESIFALVLDEMIWDERNTAHVRLHPAWAPWQKSGSALFKELVSLAAVQVSLGKTNSSHAWDNEYGGHSTLIPAFQASLNLVSNRELFEFVQADGYCNDAW
jgi:hypothetical protein